jgi:hypothetical protein
MTPFAWIVVAAVAGTVLAAGSALALWRWRDRRAERSAGRRLRRIAARPAQRFDGACVADLPEPARRYFSYMIRPGAALRPAVHLRLRGEIGLGSKARPGYRPFRADQILAPPHGFVWRMSAGAVAGSDGLLPESSWTRFRLFGLLPVVRISGDPDHRRSAFGRMVAEAAFWAPASLLPGDAVRWEAAGPDIARATVSFAGLEQSVDIAVDADGKPRSVVIQRWSAENSERTYRLQPFGGVLSSFREHEGYRLPHRVEGGNHFGTPDYCAFYRAEVVAVRLLPDPETMTEREGGLAP